jgi:sugar lactone lactonase YvrE
LAVDRSGFLWSLQTDGWCITRYDPQGSIERVVSLPVPKPIDCCFGGNDMRTLFITTSRLGLSERRLAEVPWSGGILSYNCPEPGLPVYSFQRIAD